MIPLMLCGAIVVIQLGMPVVMRLWEVKILNRSNTCVKPFYYFLAVIPVLGGVLNVISVILERDLYGDSFKEQMRVANRLEECSRCGRYSRRYQQHLESLKRGMNSVWFPCPHEGCNNTSRYTIDEKYQKKWMDTHPDCPKLGVWDFIKYKRSLNKIKKLNKDIEEVDSYLEYERRKSNN